MLPTERSRRHAMTSASAFGSADAVAMGLIAAHDAAAMESVLNRCTTRLASPGEVILPANQANSEAFIVLAGELAVKLDRESDTVTAQLGVGELVGEVSALTGNPTSAWVLANSACELLVLERNNLLQLAEGSHHFAFRTLKTVCGRLYSSNQSAQNSAAESREFQHKAFFDPLTGLKNRAWLNQNLGAMLEAQQQSDSGLHFFMVDIDHFKRFNDTWGHAVGDQVLIEVGRALQTAVRPGDHVVRLGGEEILVIADHLMATDAAWSVGERLRQAVAERRVSTDNHDEPLQVTISIGAARYASGETHALTLERADQALYRAKQAGRNRVELA
ncbi:MAG: GGDEF domain-containing protein [Cyanobacteria bacterium K_DeepCast_35m_m2_023]|nr:GGDEF domain-containing protein [Cyanobacteria bacterium K_DeepCast_35m_m2_023]